MSPGELNKSIFGPRKVDTGKRKNKIRISLTAKMSDRVDEDGCEVTRFVVTLLQGTANPAAVVDRSF